MRALNSFVIAFATYSRLPMPQVEWSDENRRFVMCFFPLIGAVIGLALGLWLLVCDVLAISGLLRGAVGAILPLLITGGIHMDGFMDTSDALASWQMPEKRLEILKDSHVGAFAVMACAGYLLAMAGLLGEAKAQDAPMLAMGFVVSRALSAYLMTVLRGARPNGMLDGFARTAQKRMVSLSSSAYGILALGVWAACGGWTALLCAAAAALCTAYYRRMAYRYFGGVTGDLAGWFLQVTELACTAAVIIGGKLI